MCSCWAWMHNPDLVPLTIQCTFLASSADYTLDLHGLPMPRRRMPPPPVGPQAEVLIHIDEHHDWACRADGQVPLIHHFSWTSGVLDDRQAPTAPGHAALPGPAQPGRPRPWSEQRSREPERPRGRCDDPDDDGHRHSGSWRERLSCRG